jgi:CRP-like cAMP-binding protein
MIAFLRQVSIFSGLTEAELDVLAEAASEQNYPEGSRIIRVGDPGTSLLIVRSGEVRVVLQKASGSEIELTTIKPGEFFGEMALFDAKPRSATVVAKTEATIIEISRETFIVQVTRRPELALKILAEMAKRLRHSDEVVKEFAERIYGELYPKLEEKLTVELDSARTIYQATEDRALKTLNHVEVSWNTLTRFLALIIGIYTVVAAVVGFFGYKSFRSIKKGAEGMVENIKKELSEKEKEVNRIKESIEAIAGEMQTEFDAVKKIRPAVEETRITHERIKALEVDANRSVNAMKGFIFDVRDISQGLTVPIAQDPAALSNDDLKNLAVTYQYSKPLLYRNYISKEPEQLPDIGPATAVEAVQTYLKMTEKNGGEWHLTSKENEKLLQTLTYAIEHSAQLNWRMQLTAREMFVKLARFTKQIDEFQYDAAIERLKSSLEADHAGGTGARKRFQISMILAALGERSDRAIRMLETAYLNDTGRGGEWRRASAAVALVRMEQNSAWNYLNAKLSEGGRDGFAAALLLGQIGRQNLLALNVQEHLKPADGGDRFDWIAQRMCAGLDTHSDRYLREFVNRLAESLSDRRCPDATD